MNDKKKGITFNVKKTHKDVDWFLATDNSRFHVYVVLVGRDFRMRIDWERTGTLVFEKIKYLDDDQEVFYLGRKAFCLKFIAGIIDPKLKQYDLLRFNCRTVTCMILSIAGFKEKQIRPIMEKYGILCGVNGSLSVSPQEMIHFWNWIYEQEETVLH